MRAVVASSSDAERLLRLYRAATLTEVVDRMVEWDHEDAFLDADGRLCVPDSPLDASRTCIEGRELEELLDHYEVERGDLDCLRRRMIFEGAWKPAEVAVENARLYVAESRKSDNSSASTAT